MVRVNQPELDIEPTPEFNQRCLDVIRRWEGGDLPYKEAIAQVTALSQEAVEANHIANEARAEQLLGLIQHYRGNLNTSIRHNERARKLYQRVGNRVRTATMDLNQGENYRFKGDFTRARKLYRAAYDAAAELNNLPLQTMAALNEGLTLVAASQYDAARAALDEGLELIPRWTEEDPQLPSILCELHQGMAIIHLQDGNHEAAWSEALKALDAARKGGQPLQLGFANRILGEVVTMMESVPDAQFSSDPDDYFRAAIDAFREINAEAELARTMFAQAKSLAIRGRRTTAARKLQQVMIIFTRLGMVDDAARAAEAQLAVL